MTPGARAAAAIEILDAILAGTPAERELTAWARRSRFAGAKDRAAVRDIVFDGLRCRRSHAALGGSETGRGIVLGGIRARGEDPDLCFTGEGHAPSPVSPADTPATLGLSRGVTLDCPDWLLPEFDVACGSDADRVLTQLQTRAPVILRVNAGKADRDAAMALLARDDIGVAPHPDVPTAIVVTTNARKVQMSVAYETGVVEVQNASSQWAVAQLPIPLGARILDYCAGGGGKALAIAARTGGTVHAHDVDPRRMADIPARAARAGARITPLTTPQVQAAGPFDLVFCDAPCSGSGTWRRSPDAKWRLTPERLEALCQLQGEVLQAAGALVAPGGRLAYATCSVFDRENAAAVARMAPIWRVETSQRILPAPLQDGFYLSVMARQT